MSQISIENYVSTDNLLQNCEGITLYDGKTNIDSVIEFQKGDILLSNIRPYLKKIWIADRDGGCNADVLVIRMNNDSFAPEFLYQILCRQEFFDYVMQDVKGMKMPRGNKNHIMQYSVPNVSRDEQKSILLEVKEYKQKICEMKSVMITCESRKKAVLKKHLS